MRFSKIEEITKKVLISRKKEYKKDKRKQEITQGGIRMWKKGRKNKTENKAEFYLFSNFKKPALCLTIVIVFM